MRDRIVLIDKESITNEKLNSKDLLEAFVDKYNAMGILISTVPKHDLINKLSSNAYYIKDKYNNLKDEFIKTNHENMPSYCTEQEIIKIRVNLDRKVLNYYLDGYNSVKIIDVISNESCILEGYIDEIKQLSGSLSKNKIKIGV